MRTPEGPRTHPHVGAAATTAAGGARDEDARAEHRARQPTATEGRDRGIPNTARTGRGEVLLSVPTKGAGFCSGLL